MEETPERGSPALTVAEGIQYARNLCDIARSYDSDHSPSDTRTSVLRAISALFAVLAELDR